jgi:hypothetical protein
MADVLFRTAFLLLYAAAWVLVFATLVAAKLLWIIARWSWRTIPPAIAHAREARRLRGAGQHALAAGALTVR